SLHLRTVAIFSIVITLGQRTDPAREALRGFMFTRDLGEHFVTVRHHLRNDLGDRTEAAQVVEWQPDHDTASVLPATSTRIFCTACGTLSFFSSSNQARSSPGASSLATCRASAASSALSADWIAMKCAIVCGSIGGNSGLLAAASFGVAVSVARSICFGSGTA